MAARCRRIRTSAYLSGALPSHHADALRLNLSNEQYSPSWTASRGISNILASQVRILGIWYGKVIGPSKPRTQRETEVGTPATAAETGNGVNIHDNQPRPIDRLYRLYPNDRTSHVHQRTYLVPAVTLAGQSLDYTQMAEDPRKLANMLWSIGSLARLVAATSPTDQVRKGGIRLEEDIFPGFPFIAPYLHLFSSSHHSQSSSQLSSHNKVQHRS